MDKVEPLRNRRWPRWWRRFQITARRANFFAVVEIVSLVAFTVMTLFTWVTLNTQSSRNQLVPTDLTATLLVGTLVPAMAILVLLGRRIALRRAAESAAGTGRLHVRLVFLFSMISAVPTLLVVIFASWLFQSGVEFWFSDNSRGLLENANKLARGYYEQTQRDVEYESLAMAGDLRDFLSQQQITSPGFAAYYSNQVIYRKLDESVILQKGRDGQLHKVAFARGEAGLSQDISREIQRRLDAGDPMVINASANRIETYTPIDRDAGVYLYAARISDLLSFSQGQRAQNIVRAYDVLTSRARVLQLRFNVALFVASLALVGLAIWFALRFADRQVKPLYDLVGAARRVGSGNYALRIEGRTGADEIGLLNRAFNRMTEQIERQTKDLVSANQQVQERRAFIEAVLESVTAGVISVDAAGAVRLINSSAQKLLFDIAGPSRSGVKLSKMAPQLAALVDAELDSGIVQYSKGNDLLTLAVRVTRDRAGHVITFEDITRQLLDQRQAAWSDVARRIAHEIKNPLTPIQLATERLNRRYRKQITTDPELFEELTSTIIRQVGDLRKMVDEFSSFARLPKPLFRSEDAVDLARQALFLQEVARPDIDFALTADRQIPPISCDRHQFGQAMTNVLKNAVEAVEAQTKVAPVDYRGCVTVQMADDGEAICITVTDNGIGLPQDRERIVEPYVTTRDKGTGLGLAIVKKIVEEHGGDMVFAVNDDGGTRVSLRFARDPVGGHRGAEAAE
ncbi:MAG TPA: ATP-binding protein [Novosphingobium sp.]|nr:ATP-binding protein [Novosphingobium sp.]